MATSSSDFVRHLTRRTLSHVFAAVTRLASVATAFPSGQAPLDVRLADVAAAVEAGADEIDMVINVRDSHAAQDSITDGYKIRRKAVDFSVTLLTDIKLATLLIGALARRRAPVIKSWDQYGL